MKHQTDEQHDQYIVQSCLSAFAANRRCRRLVPPNGARSKAASCVDGTPPKLPPLVVDKDQFCIETKPVNESVVVGKDGGLANAVVFLRLPRGGKVEVHPDYAAQLKEPAVLDNNGCSFKPHITLVRVGQPFVIKNSDPVGHNTNIAVFGFQRNDTDRQRNAD